MGRIELVTGRQRRRAASVEKTPSIVAAGLSPRLGIAAVAQRPI